MNKGELVDAVAGSSGLSRADAAKAVDAMLDAISGTLANGGSVSLVGFGTFSVKARAARMGRNPRTGEAIQIAASNVPGFKAGKGLKDAVN
jgi:DNA-binding protein HU-beta